MCRFPFTEKEIINLFLNRREGAVCLKQVNGIYCFAECLLWG